MPLILDGNNVLGKLKQDENIFIRQLIRYATDHQYTVECFLDGERTHGLVLQRMGRLTLHFSGAGRSADDAILDFVVHLKDRNGWRLITDDAALASQAQVLGVTIRRVGKWLPELRKLPRADRANEQSAKPAYEADKEGLLYSLLHKSR